MPRTSRFFPRHWVTCSLVMLLGCHAADPAPGPPQRIVIVAGNNQTAPVGLTLPTPPRVKVVDSRGLGITGMLVEFSLVSTGGYLTGDSSVTDASGVATLGGWALGTTPGTYTVHATLSGTTIGASLSATAVPGAPAAIRVIGSQLFTGLVQQPITPAPTVQVIDGYTNVIPGAQVTFAVTANNGSTTGAVVLTDNQGQAHIGSWILGSAAGANRLSATTSNGLSVEFFANGLTGAPVLTTPTPLDQSGFLGFPVTAIPRVKVTDNLGVPLANVSVAFSISGGDGVLTGQLATTGVDGMASPADWRLGPIGASSTVVATLPSFPGPQLTFHASGVATPFTIDVRFLTSMSADSRDAFVTAARRWMQIIVGDIPNQQLTLSAGACATGQPAISETIDDVVIYASVVPIDGPLNVLGSAGPCVRRTGSNLTVIGTMRFDQDDLALLQTTNRLVPTISHEMGHVLGFGTNWSGTQLVQDLGLPDPIFVGAGALSVWPPFKTALNYAGRDIPLENNGGAGTRDSHWRETVFHAELMTGTIENPGIPMPISKVTVAAMGDLGYSVDYNAADTFLGNLQAAPSALSGYPLSLPNDMIRATFEVSPSGAVRRIY